VYKGKENLVIPGDVEMRFEVTGSVLDEAGNAGGPVGRGIPPMLLSFTLSIPKSSRVFGL